MANHHRHLLKQRLRTAAENLSASDICNQINKLFMIGTAICLLWSIGDASIRDMHCCFSDKIAEHKLAKKSIMCGFLCRENASAKTSLSI
jgi:hypothetical protein